MEMARAGEAIGRALTSVTARVAPGVTPRWELPVSARVEPVTAPALEGPALSDDVLDAVVDDIRRSEDPALFHQEMASCFRSAGHFDSKVRLRAAPWSAQSNSAHRWDSRTTSRKTTTTLINTPVAACRSEQNRRGVRRVLSGSGLSHFRHVRFLVLRALGALVSPPMRRP